MKTIYAPNDVGEVCPIPTVFLAGSIEMGAAENWQEEFVKHFEDDDVVFLNPRRLDWDSSWIQSINNAQFNEQVNWELDYILNADFVVFYFDPNTLSPVTLLELGFMSPSIDIVVCCPEPYWKKGNVDIICKRCEIATVDTLDDLILETKKFINDWWNK